MTSLCSQFALDVKYFLSTGIKTRNQFAHYLTPSQMKSACYWEEAYFNAEFEEKLKKEADQEVDCSLWEE